MCYLAALGSVLIGFSALYAGSTSQFGNTASASASTGLLVFITSLAPTAALVFSGLIMHAIGSGLHALRDIARNSWR
jgi:hypothetical protein